MRKKLETDWKKILKQYFFNDNGAYYDFEEDKIYNSTPGTWTYVHEEGHRRQRKLYFKAKGYQYLLMLSTIGALSYDNKFLRRLVFRCILVLFFI